MRTNALNQPSDREETLFNAVLQLPSAQERAAYLLGACGEDIELRRRLEVLLQAHEAAGTFLNKSVAEGPRKALSASATGSPPPSPAAVPHLAERAAGGAARSSIGEKSGDRIGPYKLLQKIGEGGCGVVYMAEQEKPIRRRVALKIIKLGMDTKSVIARFEAHAEPWKWRERRTIEISRLKNFWIWGQHTASGDRDVSRLQECIPQ